MRTLPGAAVIGPLAWTAATARVLQWNRLATDRTRLKEIQLSTLRTHCRLAAGTEFGRHHRLADVTKLEDFRERVPLRAYADFEPYLERMRQGERDVLWPGLIQYFGSVVRAARTPLAQHKFLPISEQQIRWQQKAGFDVVGPLRDVRSEALPFSGGFSLGLFPPSTLKTQGEVHGTNNPGLMQRHVPWPIRRSVLPTRRPARHRRLRREASRRWPVAYLDYDVRAVSGTTCWFSDLFR